MTSRPNITKSARERCLSCKHWIDVSLSHGECRRFPVSTITEYTYWCGEWKDAKRKHDVARPGTSQEGKPG